MKKELFPITRDNKVEFYTDGDNYYEKFLNCIRKAKESIHLQTYIFHNDNIGSVVIDELINASSRGVKVYMLVDSVGSRLLDEESEKKIIDAGINFCRFNGMHLKWLYRWGRRLHHKILLIDHQEAIVGGINVLDTCLPGSTIAQLDFAVYLQGPVTKDISNYCQKTFKKNYKKEYNIKNITEYKEIKKGYKVGISVNDWIHGRSKITKQYSLLTTTAQESITIINSYFFPRKKFMKQLVSAVKRGVKVRLILPKYSDWASYVLASEHLYNYFLKGGVEIYLWEKSVLHGKLATVDNNWTTVGSFNLNYTSYQQNLEMNVDIYSKEFTTRMNQKIDHLIKEGCCKLDPETFESKTSLKTKFLRWFFYILLAMIANFSVGMSFQEGTKEHKFYSILRIVGALICFVLGTIGVLLPLMPGAIFYFIGFLLIYNQILHNKRIGD